MKQCMYDVNYHQIIAIAFNYDCFKFFCWKILLPVCILQCPYCTIMNYNVSVKKKCDRTDIVTVTTCLARRIYVFEP